jgi:hypothetical protein
MVRTIQLPLSVTAGDILRRMEYPTLGKGSITKQRCGQDDISFSAHPPPTLTPGPASATRSTIPEPRVLELQPVAVMALTELN